MGEVDYFKLNFSKGFLTVLDIVLRLLCLLQAKVLYPFSGYRKFNNTSLVAPVTMHAAPI